MAGTKRGRPQRIHPRLAVALRYEPDVGKAPSVVASGRGVVAERIQQVAEEHGVPVHQDEVLAEMLSDVEVHQSIPEEMFEAVARVLAFVWRVDGRLRKR